MDRAPAGIPSQPSRVNGSSSSVRSSSCACCCCCCSGDSKWHRRRMDAQRELDLEDHHAPPDTLRWAAVAPSPVEHIGTDPSHPHDVHHGDPANVVVELQQLPVGAAAANVFSSVVWREDVGGVDVLDPPPPSVSATSHRRTRRHRTAHSHGGKGELAVPDSGEAAAQADHQVPPLVSFFNTVVVLHSASVSDEEDSDALHHHWFEQEEEEHADDENDASTPPSQPQPPHQQQRWRAADDERISSHRADNAASVEGSITPPDLMYNVRLPLSLREEQHGGNMPILIQPPQHDAFGSPADGSPATSSSEQGGELGNAVPPSSGLLAIKSITATAVVPSKGIHAPHGRAVPTSTLDRSAPGRSPLPPAPSATRPKAQLTLPLFLLPARPESSDDPTSSSGHRHTSSSRNTSRSSSRNLEFQELEISAYRLPSGSEGGGSRISGGVVSEGSLSLSVRSTAHVELEPLSCAAVSPREQLAVLRYRSTLRNVPGYATRASRQTFRVPRSASGGEQTARSPRRSPSHRTATIDSDERSPLPRWSASLRSSLSASPAASQ